MGGVDELPVGGVPTQQGVDVIEARRVVAMARGGREDRGQVQGIGPERGDVVQVLGDPVEVAAEELPRRGTSSGPGRVIPRRGYGPVGQRLGNAAAACEAVGEDLVDDRVVEPRRGLGGQGDPEVAAVGDVGLDQPRRGEPAVPGRAAVEQKAIVGDGVVRDQIRPPPGARGGPAVDARLDVRGLAVVDLPNCHTRHRILGGCAKEHGERVTVLLRRLWAVGRRSVVVRLLEQRTRRHRPCVIRCARQPLTDPAVRPVTSCFWANANTISMGMAAMTAPAAKKPQYWVIGLAT